MTETAARVLPPQAQATRIFGLAVSFDDADVFVEAARATRDRGFTVEAYTPFPVEGLNEAMRYPKSRVPLIALLCAATGGIGGFGMMWFATVIHYHLNVGGKPANSWPAYIPITFELAVLGAAFGAVFGALGLSKLPQPYHPLFDVPAFRRASHDRFFLCVEASTPGFDRDECRAFLETLKPVGISEVPLR